MTAVAQPVDPASRVEPAVAPPPGNPRFPLIDSLRALAALSVLVYHTGYASLASFVAWYGPVVGHLDVGVPLFLRWLCGPSSRICWPNFNRRSSGMHNGPSSTASKKDVPIENKMTIMSIFSPLLQSLDNPFHAHAA